MSVQNVQLVNVTFSWHSEPDAVLHNITLTFPRGWTGIVGPNGAGKTTLAGLVCGNLEPISGSIVRPEGSVILRCEQLTAGPPEYSEEFLYTGDSSAGRLRSFLDIGMDWVDRWETLSHGERKRMQAGIALWREPDILILDEPANHLDTEAKEMLLSALRLYDGIGILISHERRWLDALCSQVLFMRPGEAVLRPGGYSEGLAQQQREDSFRENRYEELLSEARDLSNKSAALRHHESGKSSGTSKKHLARKDHDAKSRVDAARLTGKDKTGSRRVKVLDERAGKAAKAAAENWFRSRQIEGITFRGEKAAMNTLITLDKQKIPLGPGHLLTIPDLEIRPDDRIALTGSNGTGKSTLLRHILPRVKVPRDRMIYIPQEIASEEWRRFRHAIAELSNSERGLLYDAVYRLGSEPVRVIASPDLSPGEKRKLILALGLLKSPFLIIMDEPTNHMDIDSVLCLEKALKQFTGAILIVSHDNVLTGSITGTEWRLTRDEETGVTGMTFHEPAYTDDVNCY